MEAGTVQPNQLEGYANRGMGMINNAPVKSETKTKLYYAIIFILVAGATGSLGYFIHANAVWWFVGLSCFFACLGVGHIYLMPALGIFKAEPSFNAKMLFSMIILLVGMLLFFVTYYYVSGKSYFSSLFPFSLVAFVVPLWWQRLVALAFAIPPKNYKLWYYPEKPIVADMDNFDLSNFAIITYVFSKRHGDTEKSNFQTKAPYDIKLGDLFYFFIQEWNRKYPQGNIQYKDGKDRTFGWLFFVQHKWWKPKRFLNPDKTIRDNGIKVNEIVKTLRIEQD